MKTSQKGKALIKQFEGFRPDAYKVHAGEKFYTIGYGHYGPDVTPTMKISREQAEKLLTDDLVKFERLVDVYQGIYGFNQNQYDALVSFAYNVGSINQLTAYGKRSIDVIAHKMLEYTKSGGKELAGLVKRRKAEYELFTKPVAIMADATTYDGIRYLQQQLKLRGHYKGAIDGLYGPQTNRAVHMLFEQIDMN